MSGVYNIQDPFYGLKINLDSISRSIGNLQTNSEESRRKSR